nr:hypothetical protein [uncultured Roseateles sp.]
MYQPLANTPTRTLPYWLVCLTAIVSALFTLGLGGCATALNDAMPANGSDLSTQDPQLADKLVERYRRYDGQ